MKIMQVVGKKILLWTILAIFFSSNISANEKPVQICDDEAGWPPFVYHPIVDGKPDKDIINGATVEFINEIFNEIGLEYTLNLVPWKRCLSEVKKFGENRNYEVLTNASYSKERSKIYHMSLPLYAIGSGAFYSKKRFPNGLKIDKIDDLKKYTLCTVHGFTYESFGLKYEDIFTGAKSLEAALKMVAMGRYDLVLSSVIPVYASRLTGKSILPDNMSVSEFHFIPTETFHIFISRGSKRAAFLLENINNAILKLHKTGKYEDIYSNYYKQIGLTFRKPKLYNLE